MNVFEQNMKSYNSYNVRKFTLVHSQPEETVQLLSIHIALREDFDQSDLSVHGAHTS